MPTTQRNPRYATKQPRRTPTRPRVTAAYWLAACAAAMLLLISGCSWTGGAGQGTTVAGGGQTASGAVSSPSTSSGNGSEAASGAAPSEAVPATRYPLTVTDDAGRQLTFARAPERIVSFVPSNTDDLLALGLKSDIVAVDKWSAGQFKEVAGLPAMDSVNIDYEQLEALKPDLILTVQGKYVDRLHQLGLPVFVTQPNDISGIYGDIRSLGQILDRNAQAQAIIKTLQSQIAAVRSQVASVPRDQRVTVFYGIFDPTGIYSAGPGSFLDALIQAAGGVNIMADTGTPWPAPSAEQVVKRAPQVIIGTEAGGLDKLKAGQMPGWEGVPAVKNQRIYVHPDALLTQPDTHVADAVRTLAHDFYPNLVN